jgi:nucleoside-diphosphate-sugar epimerase
MKRALVCGAGGFIGGHLVKRLKREGYWVRGVDIKEHEFAPTQADEFLLLDLREPQNCKAALTLSDGHPSTRLRLGSGQGSGQAFDEVYQLAADMGGMGFIHTAECEIMHNSALINIHMIHTAALMGAPRYFFSSSVCVYRDMQPGEPEMSEDEAIPANPDNEYGWEKLYAERTAMAYARHYPIQVRIARFQNCYDGETEVLTKNGFKYLKDIEPSDEIATRAPDGSIEYHRPTGIQKLHYSGPMYSAENSRISLLITPDQNIYYTVSHRHPDFRLGKASDCWHKHFRLTRKVEWNGIAESDCFVLPDTYMSDGRRMFVKGGQKSIPLDLWLEFLGWYLSEGNCFVVGAKDMNGYRVVITQYGHENQESIMSLVRDMGFRCYLSNNQICITSKQLYNYCRPFGRADTKFIPREFLSLPKSQLSILFSALMAGDGERNGRRYSTVSRQLADDVQELALKLGYGAMVRKEENIYRVSICKETVHRISPEDKQVVDYSGMVYDVTVPNHIILIRRNGRVCWSGNCYGPEGTWTGGREKAPAAICRKVAEAEDGGTIEVWGSGTAIRSYTYVGDMVDGIYMLMQSDPSTGSGRRLEGAANIGCPQYVTVDELVQTVIEVSGKRIVVRHVEGPVGVQSRNFSNARIYSLGWRAQVFLKEGIALTYPWIEAQVKAQRERESQGVT